MDIKSKGYEYSYQIWVDDIPPYLELLDQEIISSLGIETMSSLGVQSRIFHFVIRTDFKVIRNLDNDDDNVYDCEMMEREIFAVDFSVSTDQPVEVFRKLFDQNIHHIHFRLKEYLMPLHEIMTLDLQVQTLAEKVVSANPSVPLVPIVVDIDVSTLQLEIETIYEALDRAITPECMTPLDLVRPIEKNQSKICRRRLRDFLLFGLPRVEVDKGFELMEACPICMSGPRAGTLVSWLPCKHAFHSHCLVRWLMERESCPLCRHEIVLEKGGRPKELGCYVSGYMADPHHILNSDF